MWHWVCYLHPLLVANVRIHVVLSSARLSCVACVVMCMCTMYKCYSVSSFFLKDQWLPYPHCQRPCSKWSVMIWVHQPRFVLGGTLEIHTLMHTYKMKNERNSSKYVTTCSFGAILSHFSGGRFCPPPTIYNTTNVHVHGIWDSENTCTCMCVRCTCTLNKWKCDYTCTCEYNITQWRDGMDVFEETTLNL